jgi:hypothetical protein
MFLLLIVLSGCRNLFPTNSPPMQYTPLALTPGTRTASGTTTSSTDWTIYHHDNTHTGYLANEQDPQHLARAWSTHLDGAVYAEPLVVGKHVLVVSTVSSLTEQTWTQTVRAALFPSAFPAFLPHSRRLWDQVMSERGCGL